MNINNPIEKHLEINNKNLWGILKSKFNNEEKRIRVLYRWADTQKHHMEFAMFQFEDEASYKTLTTGRSKVLASGKITYVANNCGLALAYDCHYTKETAELLVELCSHMGVGGIIYTLQHEQRTLTTVLTDVGFKSQGLNIRNPNTSNLLDILVYDYEVEVRS